MTLSFFHSFINASKSVFVTLLRALCSSFSLILLRRRGRRCLRCDRMLSDSECFCYFLCSLCFVEPDLFLAVNDSANDGFSSVSQSRA